MKLTIKDHNAAMLHDALGIEETRSIEISGQLDVIVRKRSRNLNHNVIEVLSEIATFCKNEEELVYAFYNHVNYMSMKKFGQKLL